MKLTHYISLRYIGVTLLVMLISIPVFYLVIQNVLTHNIDEHLKDRQSVITEKLENLTNGNVISFQEGITIEKDPVHQVEERISTENIYNKEEKETESFRVLQFPLKTSSSFYNVKISESLVETEDLLKSILYLLLSMFGLLTLTLLFINSIIKKNIWKPFYETLDQLKNFRVDDTESLHLEKTRIDELSDLNDSLNKLSATNMKVYQAQKEFTENASHELQTPLAIVQNNIELFWQTEPISEQQSEILNDISLANSRMTRLNKSLLLLSKIENKQFNNIQEVNLNQIADQFLRNYQEQIKFRNLQLETNWSTPFLVIMDFSLAEILVGNLMLNALKYAPVGSTIELNFNKDEFVISNLAEHRALDEKKLFKRFQRQNSQENSTGLGLEIAKQIARSFDLNLDYFFRENRHYFRVKRN
ncbi:sensor histidine kinase [Kaistella polysaccharea]|uniref:sensor histidine kinase n=1 Tax=Kaistella polysaccharea TaxID=2878534 RepID=UPI001CF19D79|nr:HAMP domain-containing sensor histidine kinase [Kaistella polysaccharea]